MRFLSDLAGTLRNALGIGRASVDASVLTANRTYALPDEAGNLVVMNAGGEVIVNAKVGIHKVLIGPPNDQPTDAPEWPTFRVLENFDMPLIQRQLGDQILPTRTDTFGWGRNTPPYRLFTYGNLNDDWDTAKFFPVRIDPNTFLGGSFRLHLIDDITIPGQPVEQALLTVEEQGGLAANRVLATPSGSAGGVGLRALVANDIPSLDADKIASGTLSANRLPGPLASVSSVGARQALIGQSFGGSAPVWRILEENDIPALSYPKMAYPPDHITGFELSRNGNNSLSIGAGTAYIQSIGQVIQYNGGTQTVPTGSNIWYHVYLTSLGLIQVVTTAPASPYFGTARSRSSNTSQRYIGTVRNDASGNLRFWKHDWRSGLVMWRENTQSTPFRVLSAGAATTKTAISCAAVAPVTAVMVKAGVFSLATTTAFAVFDTSDRSLAANHGFTYINSAGMTAMHSQLDLLVNSAQQFRYSFDSSFPSGGGEGLYVDVVGYVYER